MFREEKALPCCGSQKPHQRGLRAKGEVIKMISKRLRERKKMALPGGPLRRHLLPGNPTRGVPRRSGIMLSVNFTIL